MPDTEGQQIEDDEIAAPATHDSDRAATEQDSDDVEGHNFNISSEWDIESKSIG